MKKIVLSTIGIMSLFVINLSALNMNQAVDLAKTNNNVIKEYMYKIKESSEVLKSSKSSYKPKLNLDYSYDSKNNPKAGEDKHDSAFNATLTYNLFNGFSDKYNIKSASSNLELSKYEYKALKLDIVLLTKTNYIQYLKDEKNTNVQKIAVKNLQKQYDDAKNFFEQGVNVTLNSLLEVEIALLQAKQVFLSSQSSQKISKRVLFNTIGIILNEKIQDISINKVSSFDTNTFSEEQLENRSEIIVLRKYKQYLQYSIKSLNGNYYPKLDVQLQHKEYGNNFSLNKKDGSAKPQNIATFTASWNLYNGGADKSSQAINKQKLNQVSSQIEELKLTLILQYENAKEQYDLANKSLEISNKTLVQAKVNYELVWNSFKEGVVTSKDLLDANYLLTQALGNNYNASYEKVLAQANLERIFEIE